MIARAIVERDDRWRLFSAYELVWAGGKLAPAAAQALYWSMQLRDAVEERVSQRREFARWRAGAPVRTPAEPALAGLPVAAEPAPAMATPTSLDIADAADFATERAAAPAVPAREGARAEDARRALEAAARAAQSMAQAIAHARARADGVWSEPAEPEALLVGAPEGERPDDAAPVKIGDFAPQFITSADAAPSGEHTVVSQNVAALPRWRWPRRRRNEA
jgi:hypothetical protein